MGMTKRKKIKIADNINRTRREHGLDSTGHMLAMRGKIFEVENTYIGGVHIYCSAAGRSFSFHPDDIKSVDVSDKIKPQNFKFDNKFLDI